MALGTMSYTKGSVNAKPEILMIADYKALPITLDTTSFTSGVCKAGTPIASDGTIFTGSTASTATAWGVLLWDVPEERPQGTCVFDGVINKTVAEAHYTTYTTTVMAAFKNLEFR